MLTYQAWTKHLPDAAQLDGLPDSHWPGKQAAEAKELGWAWLILWSSQLLMLS